MEDNKSAGDMSDRDRQMAESFEFKDDKADEKTDKKSEKEDSKESKETKKDKDEKKVPKRSLFFNRGEDAGKRSESDKDEKQEKAGLFAGLLKQDIETEPAARQAESAAGQPAEPEPVEADEQLRADFQDVVVDRLQAVEQELEQPEVPDPAAVEADAEFLGHVGDRLSEGMEPEQAIEDALEDEASPPEADATEADLQNEEFFDSEPEEPEEQTPAPLSPPTSPVPPLVAAGRPPSPPSPPPIPPVPPQGPNLPPNPGNPNTPPPSPNAAPPLQNPNVVNNPNVVPMNDIYYRRRRSGDLLLGGTLGYLLGRRRGRRRAEAELVPEIEKRDEKLEDLRTKLETSEANVRRMAAEEAEMPASETVTERLVEEVPAVEKVTETIESEAPTIATEKTIVEQQERAFEQQIAEQIAAAEQAPQAEQEVVVVEKEVMIEKPVEGIAETVSEEEAESYEQEPEQIGAIVERLMPSAVLAAEKRTEAQTERAELKKDPQTMTMPELLEVAEHIHLDKTSLRELYERKRIDAVNLRRVVLEYFKGGSRYEKMLRGSLEAVEMQRELRGETRQDGDFTARRQAGAAGSLPGLQLAGATDDASQYGAGEGVNNGSVTTIFNEQEDDRLLVSNGTAIIIGVLAGIVIMVLLILYSDW